MILSDILYKEESYNIIKVCFEVHNRLGCGFLEAVYQEALAIEFEYLNIPFEAEKELRIPYRDRILKKKYRADFVCYEKIIVELKALSKLISDHEAQVINALKATGFQLGILVNFGEKSLKYKRLVRF